jgi:hypothetical protein
MAEWIRYKVRRKADGLFMAFPFSGANYTATGKQFTLVADAVAALASIGVDDGTGGKDLHEIVSFTIQEDSVIPWPD